MLFEVGCEHKLERELSVSSVSVPCVSTVVEGLEKRRQPLPQMEAIYIMVPTDKVRMYTLTC